MTYCLNYSDNLIIIAHDIFSIKITSTELYKTENQRLIMKSKYVISYTCNTKKQYVDKSLNIKCHEHIVSYCVIRIFS